MNRQLQHLSLITLSIGTALTLVAILNATNGHLIFSLDDPYIHFSVAENIWLGGYGVNLTEYSSPSSSILFPWLLAPFVMLDMASSLTLLITIGAQIGSVWILAGHIQNAVFGASPNGTAQRRITAVLAVVLPMAVNSFGLPFTGMEHSLHLLFSVLVLHGLYQDSQGTRSGWLPLAITLCALIRFEGYALALAAIGLLFWTRNIRQGLASISLLVLVSVAYVLFMKSRGLPWLPSSVLVKSEISSALFEGNAASAAGLALRQVKLALHNPAGISFAFVVLVDVAYLLMRRNSPHRHLILVCAAALAAHLLVGRYGWFGRYEIYAIGIALFNVALLCRGWLPSHSWSRRALVITGFCIFTGLPYLEVMSKTPAAARNIYQQQYQMHRFATELFSYPVAVNDLGLVSFRNDNYVLDLWGLGSETIRKLAAGERRVPLVIEELADAKGVRFAMVYDTWLRNVIPQHWCRIAQLKTSRVTAGSDTVAFYLIEEDQVAEMTNALYAFGRTLPLGASLDLSSCAG